MAFSPVTSYASRYLDRISYSGSCEPTPETLRQLHRAHLFAVAFENFDIALGRKIVCDEDSFLGKMLSSDPWKRQYSFTLVPRLLDEFAPMCHDHQTSPESPFTCKSLCTKATPHGRIMLSERKLITTQHGTKKERQLNFEEEWPICRNISGYFSETTQNKWATECCLLEPS